MSTFVFFTELWMLQLSEARLRVATSEGGGLRIVHLFDDGFHQLAALCNMSKTVCVRTPMITPHTVKVK